jgi:hypothetical protein
MIGMILEIREIIQKMQRKELETCTKWSKSEPEVGTRTY